MNTVHHRMRFPRSARLKSPSRIRRVCRHGRRRVRDHFTIHWQLRSRLADAPASVPNGTTRLAFVVSKRLGKAHARNRIKRRLREAARLNRTCWPDDADIVFRATGPEIATLPFTKLAHDVQTSLQKMAERK